MRQGPQRSVAGGRGRAVGRVCARLAGEERGGRAECEGAGGKGEGKCSSFAFAVKMRPRLSITGQWLKKVGGGRVRLYICNVFIRHHKTIVTPAQGDLELFSHFGGF